MPKYFRDINTNQAFKYENGQISQVDLTPDIYKQYSVEQGANINLDTLNKRFLISTPTVEAPSVGAFNANDTTRVALPIPQATYDAYRNAVTSGNMTPQQAKDTLQGLINNQTYGGSLDLQKLFPTGYTYNFQGNQYQFDNTNTGNAIKTSTSYQGSTTGASGTSLANLYNQATTPSANKDSTIAMDTLGKTQTPYGVTGTFAGTGSTTGVTSAIAGASAYSQQIKDAQSAQEATQKNYDVLSADISKLLGESVGRGAMQASEEALNNVPGLKNQLATINSQIQTKLAEYNALSTDVQGKPITMNSIIGAQAQIKNVAASEIGLLQAQAQGLQGQLQVAQETADRAVDLKYQDQIDLINVKQAQLAMIANDLTAKEKITADLLDRQYKEEQNQIAVQIANEKDKNATLLNLMQTYPDAGIALTDSIEGANVKITTKSKIYQDKIKSSGNGNLTSEQLKQFINKQIATPEFQALSQEDKQRYIQSQGGNPYDFTF